MLQSWVCLITCFELNVLLAGFPADTRHWLCDERPLLPQASTPRLPSPDLPLEKLLSLTEVPEEYQGTGRVKVAPTGLPSHPSLQELSQNKVPRGSQRYGCGHEWDV